MKFKYKIKNIKVQKEQINKTVGKEIKTKCKVNKGETYTLQERKMNKRKQYIYVF